MLNSHLLTDSKAHNAKKQRSIIIKHETSQGSVPERPRKDQKTRVGMFLQTDRFSTSF